jgi:hypothetical protein
MAQTADFSWFWCDVVLVMNLYLGFLLALIGSTATYTTANHLWPSCALQGRMCDKVHSIHDRTFNYLELRT